MSFAYELYNPGNSLIHRADPRLKILWLLIALTFSIFNDQILKQPFLGLTIYISLITGLAVARVSVFWLKAGLILSAIFFITNLLMWPLYFMDVGKLLFELPVLRIRYTDYGLRFATAKAFLVANPIMASIIISTTTRPYHLLQALVKFRLPYKLVFIPILALRLIPVTVSEVRAIMDAQMARGLELQKGFLRRIRNFVPIFIPLMVRMIRGVVELATSLDSKAFGAMKGRTFVEEIGWTKGDTVFLAVIVSSYIGAAFLGAALPVLPPLVL